MRALALLALFVASSAAAKVEFGLYDFEQSPGGGWQPMTAADFGKYSTEFISHYNSNKGVTPIKAFKSGNCCIAVKGGNKLTITGTPYGYQFPANSKGAVYCNPSKGYAENTQFFRAAKLTSKNVFGAKAGCSTSHNPAVFMKIASAPKKSANVMFGLYSHESTISGGWAVASIEELVRYKAEFIEEYNKNKGVKVIKNFKSGNCCVAVKGGKKLIITGTPYKYQFPASTSGGIRCNPSGGYSESAYQFYRSPSLKDTQTFSSKTACATSHNPSVFIRYPDSSNMQFGLYDVEKSPGANWKPMAIADFAKYKKQFISFYNVNKGLAPVKLFQSGNCCFGVAGGEKLTISGTPYGYQFPASQTGSIRCNPSGGYKDAKYQFYRSATLKVDAVFGSKVACASSHNPAVFMRDLNAPRRKTAAPTAKPTKAPTHAAIHCKVSDWGIWSMCSQKCGSGTQSRSRKVVKKDLHGGNKCPALSQKRECNVQDCAVHCKVTTWSKWGSCDADCGGGMKVRTRSVVQNPRFTGNKCPHLTHKIMCNTQSCPVHCKVSAWGSWGSCNAKCGGGTMTRTRKIVVEDQYSGDACPTLIQKAKCATQKCPVHCKVSQWGAWGQCNAGKCGPGHQYRKRMVLINAQFDGSKCPHLTMRQNCHSHQCPTPCEMHKWSKFSTCSKSCGFGLKTRTREIKTTPKHGGKECESNRESQGCKLAECPVHCSVGEWASWSKCSKSCGIGSHKRVRKIAKETKHGGNKCPSLTEIKSCKLNACPVHCEVTNWSTWSACNAKCGTGSQVRKREITKVARFNGVACPPLQNWRKCNEQPCPVHCKMSYWSRWSKCSLSCGGGAQARTRKVLIAAKHGGDACPGVKEDRDCNDSPCPVDCTLSEWSKWGKCSKSCGTGSMVRTKRVQVSAQYGGKSCGATKATKTCIARPCPVHCTVSSWSKWSKCSLSCAGGVSSCTRTVKQTNMFGGKNCPPLQQKRKCRTQACPIDCVTNDYGEWSKCSKDCDKGHQKKTRKIVTKSAYGGVACPTLVKSKTCNTQPCPVHCVVSEFGKWSGCSLSCGGGKKSRTRTITTGVVHGGRNCPHLNEKVECNAQACPIDCEVSGFGKWSTCTKTCGGGIKSRGRTVERHTSHGGKKCPSAMKEFAKCGRVACPVHCELSEWSVWTKCSTSCGKGAQRRVRNVVTAPINGGRACDDMRSNERACTQGPCPIHCGMSKWSVWQGCTRSCGSGSKRRVRSVVTEARHAGNKCDAIVDSKQCNTFACPVDCATSKWVATGTCTKTCGAGTRKYQRIVTKKAAHNGVACPALTKHEACNVGKCPVHCKVGRWNEWSTCSARDTRTTCGKGTQTRERLVLEPNLNGGTVCPDLVDERKCDLGACPVDCEMSIWAGWDLCTRSCGEGDHSRFRSVLTPAAYGGKKCPTTTQTKGCNSHACPIDCVASAWFWTGSCSKTCGSGKKQKVRNVIKPPSAGGKKCPHLAESVACHIGACPIHCNVGTWSDWSTCSKTCGKGFQTRIRSVATHAKHGGYTCPNLKGQQSCTVAACPVHCLVTNWSKWTGCDKSCNGGRQLRQRFIEKPAAFGGKKCPALRSARKCNTSKCPINCDVSSYGEWSTCSAKCGGGLSTSTRVVNTEPTFGGKSCPTKLEDVRACNKDPCKIDCKVGPWSKFSKCNKSCGQSTQTRYRMVLKEPKYGGKNCPAKTFSVNCMTAHCPVHCEVSKWGKWSACTVTCGQGTKRRLRAITSQPLHGGHLCPGLAEKQQCIQAVCPVDCELSPFQPWSKCSKTCGGGKMSRIRTIFQPAANGGKKCGARKQVKQCNTENCPVDCEIAKWGAFGACSVSCSIGHYTRSREVLQEPKFGGKACQAVSQTIDCNAGPCPIHCEVSKWAEFGPCSKTCGAGLMTHKRSITQIPKHGGYVCPLLSEEVGCQVRKCPVHCRVGKWGKFGACTHSCAGGMKTRSRKITSHAKYGGRKCPTRASSSSCNTQNCPVDCVVAAWNKWQKCSEKCGGGKQTRTRYIVHRSKYGGACGFSTEEKRVCNTAKCNWWHIKAPTYQAEGLASPEYFQIEFRTGTFKDSGSNSEMKIKFVGSQGASKAYSLGSKFIKGEKAVRKLGVFEDIGLLYQIELVAHGKDAWNPVDFVNVQTPDKQVVQFRADYFLSTDHKDKKIRHQLYPTKTSFKADAVVSQEAKAYSPKEYNIVYQTGGASSTSPMFIQLLGTTGKSRFYEIGNNFIRSMEGNADLMVAEPIGMLKAITLEAGGFEPWTTTGSIFVNTPAGQVIQFNTDVCIGHNKGCFQRKEVSAVVVEVKKNVVKADKKLEKVGAGSNAKVAKTPLTTRAPTMQARLWDQLDYTKKQGDTGGQKNGKNNKATAHPTNAPTNSPTYPDKTCSFGDKTVRSGWKGAGLGNEYCNLCHCKGGLLWCSQRKCGIPFGGSRKLMPKGTRKCSHTMCAAKTTGLRLVVNHHHKEARGDSHRCAYNKFTNECTCYCWTSKDAARANFVEAVNGKHNFAPKSGWRANRCEDVHFSKEFDPAKGKVHVLVSTSHNTNTRMEHDPAMVYVQAAAASGFRVCAREGKKYWHSKDHHDKHLVVDYHAWQGDFPFDRESRSVPGVMAGHTELREAGGKAGWSRSHCKVIKFTKPFSLIEKPMVIGSIDRVATSQIHLPSRMRTDSDGNHAPLSYWIENVNNVEFKACFRQSAVGADDGKDDKAVFFNWMAVSHRNPSVWYAGAVPPYAMSGRVRAGKWSVYDKKQVSGKKVWLKCKKVTFNRSFTKKPTVLTTANHYEPAELDWSTVHEPTVTYIDEVEKDYFKVCTSELAGTKPSHDSTMSWDWVAFEQ
jgi:hypothetical protein